MDKFSRTTEIDTAGVLNAIEQDTPKKSRRGKIIALIICLFVAICIWVYAMDTDTTIDEKKYDDIDIVVESDEYIVEVLTTVDVTLKGTKGDLVDIKRSEIKISISRGNITETGEYQVPITYYIDEKETDVQIIPSVKAVFVRVSRK